jgi:Ig-like domain from next to BRCA1 gene
VRRLFRFLIIVGVILALLPVVMQMFGARVPPALFTPAKSFVTTDRYVATSLFHWYTPFEGQLTGPWIPIEGRNRWTGQSKWWQTQIKQIMSANIDMIYVILIPKYQTQRIHLFKALDQLRAEGYDTPKVAPFLDPVITWDGEPKVDLASEAGKDELVSQYVRFFEQYFAASPGPYSGDYLARRDGKPILSTWHVHQNCKNVEALTRDDVASRLQAALGADHPEFAGDFVMVTTALSPVTFGFADEKVPLFEVNKYYVPATFKGIQSVQLKGGYWDQNTRTPGDFLARNGGMDFREAWGQVDRDATRRVYVESWNEYNEGSGIYAARNTPYIGPDNVSGNTDLWSASGDPFEYIKTTASGAAEFNDRPALDAEILWHDIPASMTPGETKTVTIVVRNTGDESWTAAKNIQLGRGDAGIAFKTVKRLFLDDTADEIPIYGGIFRGRPKVFQTTVTAPEYPGSYTLDWRMLQEGVSWFGQALSVAIEVTNK